MSQPRSIIARLLWPFTALQDLLERDFKLRRVRGRLRVVVEQPARSSRLHSQPAANTRPAPADDAASAMQVELRQLIGRHNGTRDLMRHLCYIERALRLGGPAALDDIPLEVLSKGLAQLKSLVNDWGRAGITDLRSRLSILVAAKEEELRARQPTNSGLSEFFTTTRIQVSEATPSDFQAAQKNWKQ